MTKCIVFGCLEGAVFSKFGFYPNKICCIGWASHYFRVLKTIICPNELIKNNEEKYVTDKFQSFRGESL